MTESQKALSTIIGYMQDLPINRLDPIKSKSNITMEQKWIRLPIEVYDVDEYPEGYDKTVPKEARAKSYADIRIDSIVCIRPHIERMESGEEVLSTYVFTTSGESFVVEIKPAELRKILGYEPMRIEKTA